MKTINPTFHIPIVVLLLLYCGKLWAGTGDSSAKSKNVPEYLSGAGTGLFVLFGGEDEGGPGIFIHFDHHSGELIRYGPSLDLDFFEGDLGSGFTYYPVFEPGLFADVHSENIGF